MRAREFLIEKTLVKQDFYLLPRLDALISRLETDKPFTDAEGQPLVVKATKREIANLKSIRKYYDDKGSLPKSDMKNLMPDTIGGVKLSAIFKDDDLGGKGVGASKANVGPVVEGLKALAIYAKLINRGKETVDYDDILELISELKTNTELVQAKKSKVKTALATLQKNVPDLSGSVEDEFRLEIALATGPFDRILNLSSADKDAWGRLSSILNYVNKETDLNKYSRFFAKNNKRDPVKIAVTGLAGEKADIKSTYVDNAGVVRDLKNLSMSIKAGSSMYEQASGLNEAGNIKFFGIFGLGIDTARAAMAQAKFKNDDSLDKRKKSVAKLYSLAAKDLSMQLRDDIDKQEGGFIRNFLSKLTTSLTGDARLVYVNFDAKGTYYKLNPSLIKNLAAYVDLDADLEISPKSGYPYLYIRDVNTGKSLFHARLLIANSGRIAHIFELDNLLELVKEATVAANQPEQPVEPEKEPALPVTPAKPEKIAKPVPATKSAPTPTKPTVVSPDEEDDLLR